MLPVDIFKKSIPFSQKMADVFRYQLRHEPVYRRFCQFLSVDIRTKPAPESVPLLPVEAFRDTVVGSQDEADVVFQSSGTTGMKRSRHYVKDVSLYRESIHEGFRHFYPLDDFVILGYTPGYSENPHSSLIWMLNCLIENDPSGLSCFLQLGKPVDPALIQRIVESEKRIMLFGAAFGLIDMTESHPVKLPENSIVMETGGMKTHRRELSREELHRKLAEAFQLSTDNIHSEYGMTEMLSQAYAKGDMWFQTPPWLSVTIRNPENPLEQLPDGQEGLIGIIDLANLHSCSFLLTADRGVAEAGRFNVLGRFEPDNLRGCNFLIDQD